MKKHTATVMIARGSNDRVRITLQDDSSRVQFVEVELSLDDFARAITSQVVHGEATYRGLDRVGLRKVRETRSVEWPGESCYDNKVLEEWLGRECQEDGWIVDTSLSSQQSVVRSKDRTIINYSVNKWVDDGEVDA